MDQLDTIPPMIGGGDMGQRVRETDWSATPLGAYVTWPQSLRSSLSMVLNAKGIAALYWGPEQWLLYNDAYGVALGDRHPRAFGRPMPEVLTDIAPVLGPQVAEVLRTGAGFAIENLPMMMRRNGQDEETVWTYSFSPVQGEGGGFAGVLLLATEMTGQKAERVQSRDTARLETALKVAQLGSYEWRPYAGLIEVDARASAIFGLPGAGVYSDADAFARVAPDHLDRQRAGALGVMGIERPFDPRDLGRTIDFEYDLIHADGTRLSILSAGVIIQDPDGTRRMVGAFNDVTEIRRAEATIREDRDQAIERETRARTDAERVQLALAAGAIIGTWHWDLPSDRFTVDDAFAHAFGLDPALGRDGIPLAKIVATVHPDDQAGLANAINDAISRCGRYAHQYRVRRTDGGYHWIEANGHVEAGPDGQPKSFPGVLLDVASRRAERMLANLAERLRTLETPQAMAYAAAETVGDALGLSRAAYGEIDAEGLHITLEQDWLADGQRSLAGKHQFAAYGSYIEALRRGEDVIVNDVTTDARTAAAAEGFRQIDVRALVNLPLMERGQLKVVFCLNQNRPYVWSDEELTFAHRVMERTEVEIARRAAEDELRVLNASLEVQVTERTREYDRAWRLSNELLVAARPDGTLETINPAWEGVLGWTAPELIGSQFMAYTHPDDVAETGRVFQTIIERPLTNPYEYRFRHKDGSYRSISWTATFEDGRVYAAGRDNTVERQQAEALRQSQKMEAVGQLTGGVAHDFNNLLTIIRSSVDFLRRPELPEARKTRYLDAVSDTVDRAAKLTGQLLAFARRQALKPEVFDVGAKLRGIGDMLDTVTGARVSVTIEAPDEPCFIKADVSQFETALVNMAVNARDAMDGEGRLTLRLISASAMPQIRGHGGSRANFVALSVSDTGSGIAPDQLSRIFEPFFTTKEVGKGTGLGLSQVFGFAKQSGGDVDVTSELEAGTTFTLYLPEEATGTVSTANTAPEVSPSPTGTGQRVLVVEDNIEVGQFCTQILNDFGYAPEWVANGEDALARLGTDGDGFDVVFSDVVMPGMGGIALVKILRERLPNLPVVLASGYSHVLARESDHGFELLHKPYSAEQLARVLQRVTAQTATSLDRAVAS